MVWIIINCSQQDYLSGGELLAGVVIQQLEGAIDNCFAKRYVQLNGKYNRLIKTGFWEKKGRGEAENDDC